MKIEAKNKIKEAIERIKTYTEMVISLMLLNVLMKL